MEATFFRHEGFLGALGALMSYNDCNTEDTERVHMKTQKNQ